MKVCPEKYPQKDCKKRPFVLCFCYKVYRKGRFYDEHFELAQLAAGCAACAGRKQILPVGRNFRRFEFSYVFFGYDSGISDYYPPEALQMLKPLGNSIFLPFICPWPAFVLLALRGRFKSRLGYYVCTAVIVALTAASMLVVLPQIYIYAYITQNF